MTPEELKKSILQLAIQGKLVDQIASEGTAEELYAQIQEEKKRLIAEKKIKKDKYFAPIKDDEIPFDIPESWKWVRLVDCWKVINGDRGKNYPSKDSLKTEGFPFISAVNLDGKCVIEDSNLLCVSSEQYNKLGSGKLISGDVVVCIRGSLGKHGRFQFDKGAIASSLVIVRRCTSCSIIDDYLMLYLDSPLFLAEVAKYNNGTAQPNLSAANFEKFLIPLPPISEQQRIIDKIQIVLPLVDRYGEAWSKLEAFNQKFPEDMKKSILQQAMQGKLVEQRAEEGTAEELYNQIQDLKKDLTINKIIKKIKPLDLINVNEIPFDIPKTWKWVRLIDVIDVRDGTHDTPKYVTKGVPLVTSKNLENGRINFETCKNISIEDSFLINQRSKVDVGDVLFAMIGTIGNSVLVEDNREFSIKNMALFKSYRGSNINMKYIKYYLDYSQDDMKKKASGGVQAFVSLNFLRNYLLPLPPLAEQKRIVSKLEEIIPICNDLI